jgi:hypothetical protein
VSFAAAPLIIRTVRIAVSKLLFIGTSCIVGEGGNLSARGKSDCYADSMVPAPEHSVPPQKTVLYAGPSIEWNFSQ